MKTLPNTETWRHRNTHLVKGNEDLSWAEYPFLWTTKKGSGVLDKHIQPTHSCPVPGHWSMEGTKSKLMETVFFLPKLLRTSPPVPLVLAWAASGACCVLWSQCAGPCSLRSPCCLFDQKLSPPSSSWANLRTTMRKSLRTPCGWLRRARGLLAGWSWSLLQNKAHVREAALCDGSEHQKQEQQSLWWIIATAGRGDLETWVDPRGPFCAVIRILHNSGSTPSRW